MCILGNCNSSCVLLSVSSLRNLSIFFFPFFVLSRFLLAVLNIFDYSFTFLLTSAAKLSIACIWDLGAWRFSCVLIIILVLILALELLLWFSFVSQTAGGRISSCNLQFPLIHFLFLRVMFPHHSFYLGFCWKIFLLKGEI